MTYRPFLGLAGGRTVRALSRIVDAESGGVRRQSASKNYRLAARRTTSQLRRARGENHITVALDSSFR